MEQNLSQQDKDSNLILSAVGDHSSVEMVGTECSVGNVTHEEGNCGHPNNCKFKWDAKEQGLILGGFSIGYTATQFIGGIIAQRVGGKWVFGPAVFLSSALSFLVPIMTIHYGIPAIMTMRVIQGMIQGPQTPAFYTISAKWLPAPEKNRMLSFILTGILSALGKCSSNGLIIITLGLQIGIILSLSSGGIITNSLGWEAPFYIVGGISCIWFLLWIYLVYDSPNEHPRISKASAITYTYNY